MPKPSWLTITPSEGNGNESVQLSATQHTGTANRTYAATVSNTKTDDCTVNIVQLAIADFVTIQGTASPSKEASTLTISGTSNSPKLTFSWKQNPAPTLVLEVPATYKAGGVVTDNGAAIEGNPGSSTQYDFEVTFQIPENTTINELVATLVVTSDAGKTAQCVITQAKGDPYLWVGSVGETTTTITLAATGDPQTLQIYSNDAWTIS